MTISNLYYDNGVIIRNVIKELKLSPNDIRLLMAQGKLPSQYTKIRVKYLGILIQDILVKKEHIFTVVNHGGKK